MAVRHFLRQSIATMNSKHRVCFSVTRQNCPWLWCLLFFFCLTLTDGYEFLSLWQLCMIQVFIFFFLEQKAGGLNFFSKEKWATGTVCPHQSPVDTENWAVLIYKMELSHSWWVLSDTTQCKISAVVFVISVVLRKQESLLTLAKTCPGAVKTQWTTLNLGTQHNGKSGQEMVISPCNFTKFQSLNFLCHFPELWGWEEQQKHTLQPLHYPAAAKSLSISCVKEILCRSLVFRAVRFSQLYVLCNA